MDRYILAKEDASNSFWDEKHFDYYHSLHLVVFIEKVVVICFY